MTGPLHLSADYGRAEDSPVWSERGRFTYDQLGISDCLRRELVDWQADGCWDDDATGRTEEEWERDGRQLAELLEAEMGLPVEFVP